MSRRRWFERRGLQVDLVKGCQEPFAHFCRLEYVEELSSSEHPSDHSIPIFVCFLISFCRPTMSPSSCVRVLTLVLSLKAPREMAGTSDLHGVGSIVQQARSLLPLCIFVCVRACARRPHDCLCLLKWSYRSQHSSPMTGVEVGGLGEGGGYGGVGTRRGTTTRQL